ncbi:hypothetical protein [Metabacillus fastidiosus]|uniref:Uncharacterized protein n=1 Tax=Metabacillus fastidiosus TaxID=1458 RepID=A0ABU6NTG0_9BACI|nr:hypothetical protein [Metabacillus fastidiosus]MED4400291.1 hypothetical protein [Metabacillus fastidiosus]
MTRLFDLLTPHEKSRVEEIEQAILYSQTDKERLTLKIEAYEIYANAVKRKENSMPFESMDEQSAALAAH